MFSTLRHADSASTRRAQTRSLRVRRLALLGLLGPPVYVLAVGLGGQLWSGYSHYAETIRTLTSQRAPNLELLVPLFAIYNVSLLSLATGLEVRLGA